MSLHIHIHHSQVQRTDATQILFTVETLACYSLLEEFMLCFVNVTVLIQVHWSNTKQPGAKSTELTAG